MADQIELVCGATLILGVLIGVGAAWLLAAHRAREYVRSLRRSAHTLQPVLLDGDPYHVLPVVTLAIEPETEEKA